MSRVISSPRVCEHLHSAQEKEALTSASRPRSPSKEALGPDGPGQSWLWVWASRSRTPKPTPRELRDAAEQAERRKASRPLPFVLPRGSLAACEDPGSGPGSSSLSLSLLICQMGPSALPPTPRVVVTKDESCGEAASWCPGCGVGTCSPGERAPLKDPRQALLVGAVVRPRSLVGRGAIRTRTACPRAQAASRSTLLEGRVLHSLQTHRHFTWPSSQPS